MILYNQLKKEIMLKNFCGNHENLSKLIGFKVDCHYLGVHFLGS